MTTHEKYDIGDLVEFTDGEGNVVQGEVWGVQPWQQARYAVVTDNGKMRSLWEAGLRPVVQS